MPRLDRGEQRDDHADEDRPVRVAAARCTRRPRPIDATTAPSGHRSRTASAAGPTSSSTTATASSARRSGWLSAAPNEPTTCSAATASADNHTDVRDAVHMHSPYAGTLPVSSRRGRSRPYAPRRSELTTV